MKNIAKHFQLNSITRWIFVNHEDWVDDSNYTVLSVTVERITTLNGEVIKKNIIERQDHVLNVSTKEDMAALAYLRMNSHYMDEEVYVGF